jgi:hypothetical protein
MINILWVLVTIAFVVACGYLFHYYSSKVIYNLVRILNLLTLIADQLKTINIILVEKNKIQE